MILAVLYRWIAEEVGWKQSFFIGSALFLHNCAGALVMKRYEKSGLGIGKCSGKNDPNEQWGLFKNVSFIFILAYVFFHGGTKSGVMVFQPSLSDQNGINPLSKAALMTLLSSFDLIGRFIWSLISLIKGVRSKLCIVLFFNELCLGIASISLYASSSFLEIACSSAFFGLCFGSWRTLYFSLIGEVVPSKDMPLAIGAQFALQAISMLAVPQIAGQLSRAYEPPDISAVFWLFAIFFFISAAILFVLCALTIKKRNSLTFA